MNKPSELIPLEHYYLSYKYLKHQAGKILDFGCGDGSFIAGLLDKSRVLYGIDVRSNAIMSAKKRYPRINFKNIAVGGGIPYPDNYFDAVTLFHVLEHVDSEARVIKEIFRVLKPGGILLLASPYKGLFTWADTANLRYRFPKLHKLFMSTFLGEEVYKERFVYHKSANLFGDSSLNRNWHTHYTQSEIEKLLIGKFQIEQFLKFSFFHPFLLVLYNFWDYIFKKHSKLLANIVRLDNKLRFGGISYNMLVVAKKNDKQ
jgi:ubiquinone/menaquinone biosynthesis C-methylase UbiE